jgi:uncharacterized membrane protein (DUF485 family)
MKKIVGVLVSTILVMLVLYFAFIYFITYSTGVRSGELIKISRKGVIVKTWEGEISQGISGAQIFTFSVEDKNEKVIAKIQEAIDNCNCHFGKWEQIKRFELTPDEWSIDGGHLTPTMKMKRAVIVKIYNDLYEKIYRP